MGKVRNGRETPGKLPDGGDKELGLAGRLAGSGGGEAEDAGLGETHRCVRRWGLRGGGHEPHMPAL